MVRTLKVLELSVCMTTDQFPGPHGTVTGSLLKSEQDASFTRTIVRSQARQTADMALSTLAVDCPDLAAVVIRTTCDIPESDPSVHAFLKSKQIDLYGRESIVGMAVEPYMVKHYEPYSDILESEKFIFD